MDNKPSQEESSSELSTDNETQTGDQGHGKPTENDNLKTESDLEREKREKKKRKRERRDKKRKEYEKHKQHRKNKKKYSSTKEMMNDPNYSPLDSEYDDYRETLLKEQETMNDMKLEIEKLRRELMNNETGVENNPIIQRIIRQKCAQFRKHLLQERDSATAHGASQQNLFNQPTQSNTAFYKQSMGAQSRQDTSSWRNNQSTRSSVRSRSTTDGGIYPSVPLQTFDEEEDEYLINTLQDQPNNAQGTQNGEPRGPQNQERDTNFGSTNNNEGGGAQGFSNRGRGSNFSATGGGAGGQEQNQFGYGDYFADDEEEQRRTNFQAGLNARQNMDTAKLRNVIGQATLVQNYRGTGDSIENFRDDLSNIANMCSWEEAHKVLVLKTKLIGDAAIFKRNSVELRDASDFETCISLLRNRFEPKSSVQTIINQLLNCKQRQDEPICEFSTRLKAIGYKLAETGKGNRQLAAQHILNAFQNNLSDFFIRIAVARKEPKTIQEAEKFALDEEQYTLIAKPPKRNFNNAAMLLATEMDKLNFQLYQNNEPVEPIKKEEPQIQTNTGADGTMTEMVNIALQAIRQENKQTLENMQKSNELAVASKLEQTIQQNKQRDEQWKSNIEKQVNDKNENAPRQYRNDTRNNSNNRNNTRYGNNNNNRGNNNNNRNGGNNQNNRNPNTALREDRFNRGECMNCGRKNHIERQCIFCTFCKKAGHNESNCNTKRTYDQMGITPDYDDNGKLIDMTRSQRQPQYRQNAPQNGAQGYGYSQNYYGPMPQQHNMGYPQMGNQLPIQAGPTLPPIEYKPSMTQNATAQNQPQ